MKKMFLKLVSCILVMTLLISTTTTATFSLLIVSAAEGVSVNNRTEKESKDDAHSTNYKIVTGD